jgi:hypothetical protein
MWRYAAARATGSSHLKSGLPCQDRFACNVVEGDILVLAIADGAGSASMADRGAEIIVETVVHLVSEDIKSERTNLSDILSKAASKARESLFLIAHEKAVETHELASTLLAAVVGPYGGVALQVGDGVIVVKEGEDRWCWVIWPQRGEFINTTRFLTDEDAWDYLQIVPLKETVTDIALMTDGLEHLALDYGNKVIFDPFFDGIFRPLLSTEGVGEIIHLSAELVSFLSSERMVARTDDDVSFIMATRRPQPNKS